MKKLLAKSSHVRKNTKLQICLPSFKFITVTRSRFDCVSFYNAGLLGLVSLEVLKLLATLNVLLREVIRSCVHLHSRLETGPSKDNIK